jgi:predicted MFS family arabinose efflux permease
MVPAMAIVTSAAQPRLRGTFLSITGATQQLASGIAAWVGGLIIAQDAAGHIVRYDIVGWLATAVALLAIALAGRIRVQA